MTSPPSVSIARILIVGAGGLGREVFQWAQDVWPGSIPRIAGFLSADAHAPEHAEKLPPVIADPVDYRPAADDGLLLAIGIPGVRRRIAESLHGRGARFVSLVHPTAIVAGTASLGAGTILCPFAVVSDAARVGACALVNYHASIAHDAEVGDYTVLSPYAAVAGGACLGADVFLGMHASVGPRRRMGDRSKVSANSTALCDVPSDSLVYGVPGIVRPLVR